MEEMQAQIDDLKRRLDSLSDYSMIPLEVEKALVARGFAKVSGTGVVQANGTSGLSTIAGISGTVYVAATSGGAVTKAIVFTNGVRTS